MALSAKTREHIQTGLFFLGAAASIWVFIHLLKSGVYGPLALLASGAAMLGFCCAGLVVNSPPPGLVSKIMWGGLGAFAAGMGIAAAVMLWEVSGR